MLILDTCALVWLASDQCQLPKTVKKALSAHSKNIFISSISAFELAIKHIKGKIELTLPPREWFELALESHGIEEIPINYIIACNSTKLPLIHNDPCDRIIMATAKLNDMIIITSDSIMPQYPGVKILWE